MNFQVGKNFVSLSKLFNEFDNGNNMVIEEKIKKEADGYGPLASAFIEGANFAIENQWISVDDDLPCNHDELFKFKSQLKYELSGWEEFCKFIKIV